MKNFKHNRHSIRQLQQAHADHLEAMFTGLSRIPGDPYGIIIRKFGKTRTFLQKKASFASRAILTGNESFELLDEIIAHFKENSYACFIEINPSNFSRSQHPFWEHMIIPHLAARGFRNGEMRCVWIYDHRRKSGIERPNQPIRIDQFSSDEIEQFYPLELKVQDKIESETAKTYMRFSQSIGVWRNYIASVDDTPVAIARLFVRDEIGYLVWGYTNERYRRQGCHSALIHRRIEDAMDAGCSTIFTVSDIDAKSASTLQTCGLRIAYNYIMMKTSFEQKT